MFGADVCREGETTLASRIVPIIFVPGVMGSRLHFTTIDEYWDPDSEWRMSHWLTSGDGARRQEMHHGETAEVMTEGSELDEIERTRGWGGVAWGFYGGFLRWLSDQMFVPNICPVYAVGYDWRQTNRASGHRLTTRINEILEAEHAEHCIIVTHSMGGIVTRAALKHSSEHGGALCDKVKGVIHVVQPVTGAVKFYRMCYTGARREWDGGAGFIASRALVRILGNTPVGFATVVSGLPGPVQLMPTNDYRYWNGAPWLYSQTGGVNTPYPGDAFANYLSPNLPPGAIDPRCTAFVQTELRNRIEGARTFHAWLGLYKLPEKTWAIYSTGLASDHQSLFRLDAPGEGFHGYHPARQSEGDGTVPGPSAAALFPEELNKHHPEVTLNRVNRQFEVLNVEHGDAFKDDVVRRIVRRFVNFVR